MSSIAVSLLFSGTKSNAGLDRHVDSKLTLIIRLHHSALRMRLFYSFWKCEFRLPLKKITYLHLSMYLLRKFACDVLEVTGYVLICE